MTRLEQKCQHELEAFFDGLKSDELDALIGSFAGEPKLQHPGSRSDQGQAARIYDELTRPLDSVT